MVRRALSMDESHIPGCPSCNVTAFAPLGEKVTCVEMYGGSGILVCLNSMHDPAFSFHTRTVWFVAPNIIDPSSGEDARQATTESAHL